MDIFTMKIEDYEEVFNLWSNTDGMGLRSLDDSKEGIHMFLNRNPNTNFICRNREEVVGVILSGHDGRRGYIYHAVVKHSYRRLGIGKRLVNKVIAALKEEGINKVALVCFSNNQKGNKFWGSIGFNNRSDLNYRDFVINRINK